MAQRVLGIDLGAHTIKVAVVEAGFRSARLVHLRTMGVLHGPTPPLARSLEALRESGVLSGPSDVVVVGVPGDRVLVRSFDIPLGDQKRLSAVVGNELADDIPWELEDAVFDFLQVATMAGRVLAVAARSAEIRDLLAALGEMESDPRSLPPAPLAYGSLLRRLGIGGRPLVVDLGHIRTNLCLLEDGRPVWGRTLFRGGHQVTEALRQAYQLSYAEAEQLKERVASLREQEIESEDPVRRGCAAVTLEAISPLVREIRLSEGILSARFGQRPDRLLLCGGTSLMVGMAGHLAAQIELPCERLRFTTTQGLQIDNLTEDGQSVGAQAIGLCLEQGGRTGLDLRQGEFSFRSDRSVFRDKLVTVAVSVVLVLVFAALNALLSLYSLRTEEQALRLQLKKATRMVFGRPELNPLKVSKEIRRGSMAVGAGIPEKTAFDMLNMLSVEIPGRDQIKLDLNRLDIKPGKTYLTGTADSRTAIGEIVQSLEKVSCFSKVTSGKISDVADGKKQFSLTINTTCF